MIIPVNIALGSASENGTKFPPQLVQFGSEGLILIELQGKLDVAGENDGQTIGTLKVDEATKKPTLLIGHHLLEGKLVNLQKPLAVLHKRSDAPTQNGTSMDIGTLSRFSQGVSWDMIAVVKRKMVFSRRPMPMVGKVASTAPVSRGGTK